MTDKPPISVTVVLSVASYFPRDETVPRVVAAAEQLRGTGFEVVSAHEARAGHVISTAAPSCPQCIRGGVHPPGSYLSKSQGGTETWSCGHCIGK